MRLLVSLTCIVILMHCAWDAGRILVRAGAEDVFWSIAILCIIAFFDPCWRKQ